ncbi:hypothetical protein ACKWTF_016328 [Chironomus riparius]
MLSQIRRFVSFNFRCSHFFAVHIAVQKQSQIYFISCSCCKCTFCDKICKIFLRGGKMNKINFQIRIISLMFFTTYCSCQQSVSEINQLIRKPTGSENLASDVRQFPDSYFLDFLKKHDSPVKQPTIGSSEEGSQVQLKKILTEERLEKMENRMVGEVRKINLKLMRLEDNLKNLTNKIEDLIKSGMNNIKDEMIRSMRENMNRN